MIKSLVGILYVDGAMAKGWNNNNFFDRVTGAMYKGWHNVDGVDIYFNEVTGKRM